MEEQRRILEQMIDHAVENGKPLFIDGIVEQSQEMDKKIVSFMRGGANIE